MPGLLSSASQPVLSCTHMTPERRPPNETLHQTIVRIAREVTLAQDGHAPALILSGGETVFHVAFDSLPATHQERLWWMAHTGADLGLRADLPALEEVYFVTEGWMSEATPESPPSMPPSQDPQRVEVLVVSRLRASDREASLTLFEMKRDEADHVVELCPKPLQHADSTVQSPLLTAFLNAYEAGRRTRRN